VASSATVESAPPRGTRLSNPTEVEVEVAAGESDLEENARLLAWLMPQGDEYGEDVMPAADADVGTAERARAMARCWNLILSTASLF